MDNIFIIALLISIIFFLSKIMEFKVLKSEEHNKPIKFILRDTLLVYFSVIVGYYTIEQITPTVTKNKATPAFTNTPDF